jgi:Glyoxalase/Bleomycin resistance protein/Dioxygenase superfamily
MAPSKPFSIVQVALVVSDLRATMKRYHEVLGWGPWNVYEYRRPWLNGEELHGKPAAYTMLGAETQVGSVWFELLEPGEGPSIYKEWLEAHGEGVHHLMVDSEEYVLPPASDGALRPPTDAEVVALDSKAAELRDVFAALGVGVLMGGRLGRASQFYYLDTEPMLKVILEGWAGHPGDLVPIETYP